MLAWSADCESDAPGAESRPRLRAFLDGERKGAQQWELERRFHCFERAMTEEERALPCLCGKAAVSSQLRDDRHSK